MARNLVNAEAVGVAFGVRPVLDGASLGVAAGERIGVVGRNGGGKSTLLRVLAAEQPVDTGRVTHTGGLRLGLLSQADEADPDASVRAVVLGERATHDWAGDAGVRDVLAGLLGGHDPAVLDRRLGPLSGGERRRVELARLLVADLDLLLLDEPTNHLDVEGVDWLARHFAARPSLAVVLVTHDRWFLDAVSDRTWEVVDGRVEEYEGGYSAYVLAKAERARQAAAAEARRANLLRKELAWLRRGPPARTSKPRFRIDAANALIAAEPPARDSASLLRLAGARLGRTVVELEDVTVRVPGDLPGGPGRSLLERVTWGVAPGERVGVVGVNGAGKTTLLRTLLGQQPVAAGRVVTGRTVQPALLSQHLAELDPSVRLLEAVERVAGRVDLGDGRELTASQVAERLGFGSEQQWTPVGDLSGGERRRLQLTRLLMSGPNLLLLDEPTNDLDVETLTAFEDLLDGFGGSLVVVSHDRYFLERVCDRFVGLLGDGRVRDLPGGVEEYLRLRRETSVAPPVAAGATAPPASTAGEQREARKELARVERQLERLAAREREVLDALAAHATDHVRVAELDGQLRALVTEREDLEEQWLAAAERAG